MAAERLVLATLFVVLATACGSSASPGNASDPGLTEETRSALALLHYDDAPPPADPSNRVADDAAAARFGQRLFFNPSLSGKLLEGDNDGGPATLGRQGEAGKVSCSACHVPGSGFVDSRSPHKQISLAAQWTVRRAPTLLEVSFAPLYNWDGRRDSVWEQAIGVMESDREFNSGRLFVAEQIFRQHRAEYEAIFGAMPALDDASRFTALAPTEAGCDEIPTMTGPIFKCRGKPGDGADFDRLAEADQKAVTLVVVNVAKALAAYVRELRCGQSRFEAWLDGDAGALTDAEQRGATLFVEKGRCSTCHAGPNLTDGAFHNVGLAPSPVAVAFVDANDRGAADGIALMLADPLNSRGEFSDGARAPAPDPTDPKLVGAFRTPTLRCSASRPSFMHTGQLLTVAQVIAFHDRGGDAPGSSPGASELQPLGLTEAERSDLTAFLGALDGPGPSADLLGPPP